MNRGVRYIKVEIAVYSELKNIMTLLGTTDNEMPYYE